MIGNEKYVCYFANETSVTIKSHAHTSNSLLVLVRVDIANKPKNITSKTST